MTEYRTSKTTKPRLGDPGGAFGVGNLDDLDANLLVKFSLAALSTDRRAMSVTVNEAIASGISPDLIVDRYVPALARQMGDAWCKDEMSFSGVTIGVSRLQSLLHELGPAPSGKTPATADAPTVLIVVAKDIFHTLGAVLLAGQLRRRGLSVNLLLDAHPDDVRQKLVHHAFDAVFISASIGETLESLRGIVKSIHEAIDNPPPVVIGGTILETDYDVKAATGATFTTKDPDEAIVLCGLKTKSQASQDFVL